MITETGTDIEKATMLLQQNELVAIPTETVYGLAGNALSPVAIAKIYEAKNRPQFNPLIMHVSDIERIGNYAYVTDKQLFVLKKFMPGPFTVLLKKKETVPDLLTAGSNKVAIRIPDHPLTKKLLQQLTFPLAAPSANPSGYISPVTAEHVKEGLNGKIPYILNGGTCAVGIESTIAEIDDDKLTVHRLGGMAIEDIEKKSGMQTIVDTEHERPMTSGQLKSHYAPHTPLYLGNIEEHIEKNKGKKIAVISFQKSYRGDNVHNYILSPAGDFTEAAAALFKTLREVDQGSYDLIVAEKFPNEYLGAAINDRLQRAQAILK